MPTTIKTSTEGRLQELLAAARIEGSFRHNIPRLTCEDGFSLSVQASTHHYASPREDVGPWRTVELGYPSERVEAFMPYIDGDDSDPTDTVYGYVPIATVAAVLDAHGGLCASQVEEVR